MRVGAPSLVGVLSGLLLLWAARGDPSQGRQVEAVLAENTAWVSCWDFEGHAYESRAVRSVELVSPEGLNRVYVIAEARAIGKDQRGLESCENRTRLFISRRGAASFSTVFVANAVKDGPQGNGLQLIDWSADSRYVLGDLITWRYFSEGWAHNALLYSVQNDAVVKLDLNSLFTLHAKKDCTVDGKLLGFLRDGRLAFRAWGVPDEEGESCVSRASLWAIDWKASTLNQISSSAVIRHNGHFAQTIPR